MSESKLIELGYYDPSAKIRLSAYADTVVLDPDKKGSVICAIRFGGYPEMVRAMADAIYGGATIEATQNGMVRKLQSKLKGYQRQITHDAYTPWQRSWQQTTHRKKHRCRMKTGRRMTGKKEMKKPLRKTDTASQMLYFLPRRRSCAPV